MIFFHIARHATTCVQLKQHKWPNTVLHLKPVELVRLKQMATAETNVSNIR